ncbi:hypothetical protein IEQ34_022183 [Dendrobium chrysotoxum]|uniref:Uncharacterized protein n=1 Tax=Dendrobium chrysotoxum TaxID=161865 RepID=A0AAV7FYB2_DENCH|nr:hypothetical protein IEQ34_022183 [Dendrobium chrysotoxum]
MSESQGARGLARLAFNDITEQRLRLALSGDRGMRLKRRRTAFCCSVRWKLLKVASKKNGEATAVGCCRGIQQTLRLIRVESKWVVILQRFPIVFMINYISEEEINCDSAEVLATENVSCGCGCLYSVNKSNCGWKPIAKALKLDVVTIFCYATIESCSGRCLGFSWRLEIWESRIFLSN